MWWEGCDIVRCGFWTDWSRGASNGSTLTLPDQWALIVSAFLALFVKLVGGYLWEILCFTIHQLNVSSKDQDDIHHQLQLALRNTESESSFVWKVLKIGNAHRGVRLGAYRRSAFLILLAVLHGLGIWVAGGLSSQFIPGSDQVQLIPRTCGWMKEVSIKNLEDDTAFETANALIVMARHIYHRSTDYTRSCYRPSQDASSTCNSYLHETLPYDSNTSVPCPFDEKICSSQAISLDTGFLRSDQHLGINSRPSDAISFRKVLTCAPLDAEKYADDWIPVPNRTVNDTLKGYKLGKDLESTILTQYPFWVDKIGLDYGDMRYRLQASAFINYRGYQDISFEPIAELQSPNSDLTVVSLINRVGYRTAVHDRWFRAEDCTERYCMSTDELSFLGCQERYQFCDADKNCSPFTGLYGISADPKSSPNLNPTQKAIFELVWKISWATQLNFQLGFVGTEGLVANEYLWDGGFSFWLSATLPDDHWHREVTNWMNTTLATMQIEAFNFARPDEFDVGPGLPVLQYIVPPKDPEMQDLCHKIKGRSGAHTSFSVVGLFTTIGIGLLIIALNLGLPRIVRQLQKRSGKGLRKKLEWIETGLFQLQRMAAEGRGIGPWTGVEADVPRLVEVGYTFNLTSLSLENKWSKEGESMKSLITVGQERGAGSQGDGESLEMKSMRYRDRKTGSLEGGTYHRI